MELKYNIGAGKTVLEGYEPIDMGGDIRFTRYNEVSAIYSSHFIEYFDEGEAMDILKNWNRALKADGILHIAVPDFEGIVTAWQQEGVILAGPLYGKMSVPVDSRNWETIYHKSCYCYPKLRDYLLAAGFRSIRRHINLMDWPKIDDCSRAEFHGIPISLNLSCIK